ncbi:MAG: hypothetical protein WKG00_25170 [Polyangiaceae bacterium]
MRASPWLPAVCALLCMACGSDEDDGATPTGTSSSSSGAGASSSSSSAANSSSTGPGSGGEGGAGAAGGGGNGGVGAATNGDFACIGSVTWPAPAVGTVTIELNVTAEVIQGGAPIEGITVKACAKVDTACAAPLATAATNANGQVSIEVPVTATAGFDGYFELTSPDIPPSLVFVYPPPFEDIPPGSLTVPLIDNNTLGLLGNLIDLDPARGHVAVVGLDCTQTEASGLSFASDTADASSSPLYVQNGLPSLAAEWTDETGVGAIFNVIAGPANLTSTVASTATQAGTIAIFTRPGTFSYATLPPTP